MKTFLANGLHKTHFSQRATKKILLLANGLHTIFFSQRATQKIYEKTLTLHLDSETLCK